MRLPCSLFGLLLAEHARSGGAHAAMSMEQLKAAVLPYLQPEAAEKLRSMDFTVPGPPPRQRKIDHFVFLYMENHAADNFFGCMDLPGFDGIRGHSFPVDPDNLSKGMVNVTCGGHGSPPYVCKGGPGYDNFNGKFGASAKHKVQVSKYPYSEQSDKNSGLYVQAGSLAINMFSPEQIPIKHTLALNFGVHNRMYTATPTASTPNHLFTQSGTSCGMTSNGLWKDCGGSEDVFPQPTIWDSLRLHNVSFGLYMNSTCGLDGSPCHGEDPHDPDSGSAVDTPDVAMVGVNRHTDRFYSQTVFYEQAQNGSLPAVSWLLPSKQACDHPCFDIAKGERLLKDVYEAVRTGPGWDHTLLVVAYDDAGGYYDHVVPPVGVPADESPCNIAATMPKWNPKCGNEFDFRRLGLRTTSMMISPWVGKGTVFQEPKKGPFNTSQFELSSIPSTIKALFNLSFSLTKRDAWAAPFDELLLDEPRGDDSPHHLPEAPPPSKPWDPPPKADPASPDSEDEGEPASGEPLPQHCSNWHGGEEKPCRGPGHASLKQRRNVRLFAELTNEPMPDVDQMDVRSADRWLTARWERWMAGAGKEAEPAGRAAEFV